METDPTPYDEAVAHLVAARKLLARPAAQGRALAKSGSPNAKDEGEAARLKAERLRSRITRLIEETRSLEAELYRAQGWHDRYVRVKHME